LQTNIGFWVGEGGAAVCVGGANVGVMVLVACCVVVDVTDEVGATSPVLTKSVTVSVALPSVCISLGFEQPNNRNGTSKSRFQKWEVLIGLFSKQDCHKPNVDMSVKV